MGVRSASVAGPELAKLGTALVMRRDQDQESFWVVGLRYIVFFFVFLGMVEG